MGLTLAGRCLRQRSAQLAPLVERLIKNVGRSNRNNN
jgi:hypothetical protein